MDEQLQTPDAAPIAEVEAVDADDVQVAGIVVEGPVHAGPADARPLEVGVAGVEGAAGLRLPTALAQPGHLDVDGVEATTESWAADLHVRVAALLATDGSGVRQRVDTLDEKVHQSDLDDVGQGG